MTKSSRVRQTPLSRPAVELKRHATLERVSLTRAPRPTLPSCTVSVCQPQRRHYAPEVRQMTAEVKPASLQLTERQEARRRRILHASARLASRGGFDAVQMREV